MSTGLGKEGGLWAAPEQSHPRDVQGCCGHFGLSAGGEQKAACAQLKKEKSHSAVLQQVL